MFKGKKVVAMVLSNTWGMSLQAGNRKVRPGRGIVPRLARHGRHGMWMAWDEISQQTRPGKLRVCYKKTSFWMGKSTISIGPLKNSYVKLPKRVLWMGKQGATVRVREDFRWGWRSILPMTDPWCWYIWYYMVCHGSHQYTPVMSAYLSTSTMDPSWVMNFALFWHEEIDSSDPGKTVAQLVAAQAEQPVTAAKVGNGGVLHTQGFFGGSPMDSGKAAPSANIATEMALIDARRSRKIFGDFS